MKHAAFVMKCEEAILDQKVQEWIKENEDNILEIVDIEYSQRGDMCIATITYLD